MSIRMRSRTSGMMEDGASQGEKEKEAPQENDGKIEADRAHSLQEGGG